jgi:hypothetical protein
LQILIKLIVYKTGAEVAAIRIPFGTRVFIHCQQAMKGLLKDQLSAAISNKGESTSFQQSRKQC